VPGFKNKSFTDVDLLADEPPHWASKCPLVTVPPKPKELTPATTGGAEGSARVWGSWRGIAIPGVLPCALPGQNHGQRNTAEQCTPQTDRFAQLGANAPEDHHVSFGGISVRVQTNRINPLKSENPVSKNREIWGRNDSKFDRHFLTNFVTTGLMGRRPPPPFSKHHRAGRRQIQGLF